MVSGKMALIVDDEVDMANYLSKVASIAGFQTTVVHSAAELFTLQSQQHHYAVIILDLVLPDRDGVELLRELAEESCSSALILVSGYDDNVLDSARQVAEARGLRVLGALTKPIRPPELMALLKSLPEKIPLSTCAPASATITLTDLQRALAQDELVVFFQPQVTLADGKWVGMEALVRWQHPQIGLLDAYSFVPLIEKHDLVLSMTRIVASKAMQTLQLCVQNFGFNGVIAINLAPASLTDLNFPEQMLEVTLACGCTPRQVRFEITETSIPTDLASAMDILTRLRLKGFELSIDDFGTGYSTMTSLRNLPISELKLDISFIRSALTDRKARMIALQSLSLGKDLGLRVLAEGVETEAHWRWLQEAGCDWAQGYYISRPIPEDELENWFARWSGHETRHKPDYVPKLSVFNQPPRGITVLVVDDEPEMQAILARFLTMNGYEVDQADCVDRAWELLSDNGSRFGAVITDRLMPGRDGLELVKKIKNDSQLADIPVIVQTALGAELDIHEGINAGAYFYLAKPYERNLLLAVVAAAIDDARRRHVLREETLRLARSLNLLHQGEYRLRTLRQANDLAALLASSCVNRDAAAIGFSELLINAVEHGNLGIGYQEKSVLMETGRWLEEINRRLALPEQQDRYVSVQFRQIAGQIQVSINDQGKGFDYRRYLAFDPSRITHPHGRGIAMARQTGFEAIEFRGCGNQVMVTARAELAE